MLLKLLRGAFSASPRLDPAEAARLRVRAAGDDPPAMDEAIDLLRASLDNSRRTGQSRLELAMALERRKRLSEAIEHYRTLLRLGVEGPEVPTRLGNCLSRLGRATEAIPFYRRAIELDPGSLAAHSSLLGALNFDAEATPQSVFEAHRNWGRCAEALVPPQTLPPRPEPTGRRLRIGYVSPDFKRHPVTYLFAPALEQHDRIRFEIVCYDNHPAPDAVTARLRAASDAWHEVAPLTDAEFCKRVRADGVDILVDLAGHTTHSRLSAFAHRPAPLQVSWLGYFNTTGLEAMDAFISDPHSSPPGQERWFSEKLIRLPHTRFPYEPPAYAPPVAPLPALCNGHVTFGCFNNLSKVNDRVLALWKRVLEAVPGSRLLIMSLGLHDEANAEHMLGRFARHGMAGPRLELRPYAPHEQSLAAHCEIDIALDPFPFAGGLTSLESLWMGVPVITLDCPGVAGRQTLCFARNLDLESLVGSSEDEYVRAAVALAGDLAALSTRRLSLRERMRTSPLMDARTFTAELERAFEALWHEKAEGP